MPYRTNTNLARGNFASVAGTLTTTNGISLAPADTRGAVLRNGGAPENTPYSPIRSIHQVRIGEPIVITQIITPCKPRSRCGQRVVSTSRQLIRGAKTWGINGLTDNLTVTTWDYGILTSNRPHNFTNYGTYTLPFGANGFLFRNSSGIVKKVVEGWQLSWTSYAYSGQPMSITTLNSLWAGGQPDLVRPDLLASGKWACRLVDRRALWILLRQSCGWFGSVHAGERSGVHVDLRRCEPTKPLHARAQGACRSEF